MLGFSRSLALSLSLFSLFFLLIPLVSLLSSVFFLLCSPISSPSLSLSLSSLLSVISFFLSLFFPFPTYIPVYIRNTFLSFFFLYFLFAPFSFVASIPFSPPLESAIIAILRSSPSYRFREPKCPVFYGRRRVSADVLTADGRGLAADVGLVIAVEFLFAFFYCHYYFCGFFTFGEV